MNSLPFERAQNLDAFPDATSLRAHGVEMATLGAPNAYLSYVETKAQAMEARKSGDTPLAIRKEIQCDRLYPTIPNDWKW